MVIGMGLADDNGAYPTITGGKKLSRDTRREKREGNRGQSPKQVEGTNLIFNAGGFADEKKRDGRRKGAASLQKKNGIGGKHRGMEEKKRGGAEER